MMSREQLLDVVERALWTAVQTAVATFALGMGWRSIAAAGIGAGLSVLKTGVKARVGAPQK